MMVMGMDAEPARAGEVEERERPLEVAAFAEADPRLAQWVAHATAGFVVLGIVLRVVRYLLNYPLWCDESMFAANFLDRGFSDLFRPLGYRQVSPLLFLLTEYSAIRLLGFSEMTLRLVPFVCGVASVPLFRHVAGRVLGGVPLLLAVAIFAVSEFPTRYATEAKPYSSDLFVALALLAVAIEWWRKPEQVRWLWALAAFGPLALCFSFPSVFIAGGIGLGLLPMVWRARRRGVLAPFAAYGVGLLTTFLFLLRTYKTAPQDHAYFHHDWADAFPPLDNVFKLVAWFLTNSTGAMFAYPVGGARGLSSLSFIGFVLAAIVLWRRGRRTVLGLCILPFALALVAAAMHRYPYGMSARTMQYVVPSICLLTGLGAALALGRLGPARKRCYALRAAVVALAALGFWRLGYDVSHPYKFATDERTRAFARWFWSELSQGAELVCAKEDLGTVLHPNHWGRDATDAYLCNMRIYSPRHRDGRKPQLASVSAERPLRCVFFNEIPWKSPAFGPWMQGMLERYELRKLDRYPIGMMEKKRGPTWETLYLVYEFVPRADRVARTTPSDARRD